MLMRNAGKTVWGVCGSDNYWSDL